MPEKGVNNDAPLMRWERVFKKVQDACVSIESFNQDHTMGSSGCGFIIKPESCYYIICPAHAVLNSVNPVILNTTTGSYNYQIWDEIYALISGINGTKESRYYRLKLLAIDGAGDLALLEIVQSTHNKNFPKLTHHTFLKFSSKRARHGQIIAAVGYTRAIDHQSISTGVVREPNHLRTPLIDPLNYIIHDVDTQQGNSGSPLLNAQGDVVGMNTFGYGDKVINDPLDFKGEAPILTSFISLIGGGPDAKTIVRFVKAYLHTPGHFSDMHEDGRTPLMSSFGSYKRYLKGYIGIQSDVFGSNLDLAYFPAGTEWPNRNVCGSVVIEIDENGAWAKSGLGTEGDLPQVLLKLDNCKIGTIEDDQHSIADIAWEKLPGDKTKVEYISLLDFINNSNPTEDQLTFEDWPTIFDIPIPSVTSLNTVLVAQELKKRGFSDQRIRQTLRGLDKIHKLTVDKRA